MSGHHRISITRLALVFGLLLSQSLAVTPGGQLLDDDFPGIESTRKGSKIAWVYFKDKGPRIEQKSITAALSSTGFRSLERRRRHLDADSLVDIHDVPIDPIYLESVRPFVLRLRHESRWLNAVSVEATDRGLRSISALPCVHRVEYVRTYLFREPDRTAGPFPPETRGSRSAHALDYGPSLNQTAMINVPALHDSGYTGNGVLVCMLDTGFDRLDHEALRHLDIIDTWDFVNGDPNVFSEQGQMGTGSHGTQTLAVLAGFSPGRLIGPAFGASFLLAKTENTEWERRIEEDHWVAGLEWAERLGADVVSSSLGYRDRFTHGELDYRSEDMDGNTTVVSRAANVAAAKGVLIVNSVGNEGPSTPPDNSIVAPSDSESVLAVGAVTPLGLTASFSSMGPTADGRIKPDVVAQGQSVFTVGTVSTTGYGSLNGTSFSCPLVAGVAALLLEAHPDWSNTDIISALKTTARQSFQPNNRTGWGIVDALAASQYDRIAFLPPSDFAVTRLSNNFGFFTQYVDVLTWTVEPLNAGRAVGYRIKSRRSDSSASDFELLLETDAQTFRYERRGLLEEDVYVYRITSLAGNGAESSPTFADSTTKKP